MVSYIRSAQGSVYFPLLLLKLRRFTKDRTESIGPSRNETVTTMPAKIEESSVIVFDNPKNTRARKRIVS